MIMSLLRGAVPASRRFLAPALALAAVAVATSAQAQTTAAPVTFAQFTQAAGTGNAFTFTDNDASGTLTASTQVNFEFLILGGGLPLDRQRATLSLTSSTTAPAVTVPTTNGVNVEQPFNGGLTLSIIRNSDGANLLTATTNTATLGGELTSRSAGLQASNNAGDNLVFTSQFINFSQSQQRALSLAFTSLITAGTGAGLTLTGRLVDSFTAAGAGSFSADINVIPEPASMVMMGLGLAAIPGLVIARRKRTTRTA